MTWALLAVPLSLGLVVSILAGVSWYEQRLLSSAALIRYGTRSRRVGPDTVELVVAANAEALLRDSSRR